MLTLLKRIYVVYFVFIGLLTGFIALNKGFDPTMIGVIIDVSFIFLILIILLYLMGKPPKHLECIEKFQNATIDKGVVINRRKLRRWVSCSVCIDGSRLVICTFGKEKEAVEKTAITEVYLEGKALVVEFPGKKWYLSTENADTLARLQRFLKENES